MRTRIRHWDIFNHVAGQKREAGALRDLRGESVEVGEGVRMLVLEGMTSGPLLIIGGSSRLNDGAGFR